MEIGHGRFDAYREDAKRSFVIPLSMSEAKRRLMALEAEKAKLKARCERLKARNEKLFKALWESDEAIATLEAGRFVNPHYYPILRAANRAALADEDTHD